MIVEITTRPIVTWPGKMTPHHQRETPRYGCSGAVTRHELMRELQLLKATDVFIQAAYTDDQIRIDGLPRAGAVPAHPGVILTYTRGQDTYQLPCDTFRSAEQNLRAIGLTLQRLRLIEETGVRTHGAQYAGFKRLPAPPAEDGPHTIEEAAAVLARFSDITAGDVLRDPDQAKRAIRMGQMATHPDRGGDTKDFIRVNRAAELLKIA